MTDLDKALTKLQSRFGQVYQLGELPTHEVISTGSLSLDYAIGIGGFPSNKVIEIAGAEGTGKTTSGPPRGQQLF